MLSYPEVISASGPDFVSVTNHVRNETGAKVTSQVDSVASLPTEASANAEDEEEEAKGHERTGANVASVGESEDDKLKNGASDELGEEHASSGHESSGICAEDTSSRVLQADSSDTRAALVHVKSRLVVGIDDGSSSHGTQNLSEHVDGELAPWVTTEDAVGKCNSRVKMTSRLSTNIDTKHNGQTKQKQVSNQFRGGSALVEFVLTPNPRK